MKQCACGSYAINIERLNGHSCDVCHYKNRLIAAKIEFEKLIDSSEFCSTRTAKLAKLLGARDQS